MLKRFQKCLLFIMIVSVFAIGITQAQSEDYQQIAALEHPAQKDYEIAQWNPSGTQLAIGGDEGIWIFDEAFNLVQSLPLSEGVIVNGLSWHPNEPKLAFSAISDDFSADLSAIWDTQTNEVVQLPYGYGIAILRWSPDGSILAVGWDGGITLIDTLTAEVIAQNIAFELREIILDMVWNPNGSQVVTISEDGKLRFRDKDTGRPSSDTLLDDKVLLTLDWSPENELALGEGDGTISIFEMQDPTPLALFKRQFNSYRNHPCTVKVDTGNLEAS